MTRLDCPVLSFSLSANLGPDLEKILKEEGQTLTDQIRSAWTGWRGGTGRSMASWRFSSGPLSLTIENDAAVNGRYYAQYVHRAGQRQTEFSRLQKSLVEPATQRIIERLGASLRKNATPTVENK